MDKYNFQVCPKIVIFSHDLQDVLLCKRKDEKDFNSTFSFIGGKMEITDKSVLDGIAREKNEEVGVNFKIKLNTKYCTNLLFTKGDGTKMILLHFCAIYVEGEIILSKEYSEFAWVPIKNLANFEPKIHTIPQKVTEMQFLLGAEASKDYMII